MSQKNYISKEVSDAHAALDGRPHYFLNAVNVILNVSEVVIFYGVD